VAVDTAVLTLATFRRAMNTGPLLVRIIVVPDYRLLHLPVADNWIPPNA